MADKLEERLRFKRPLNASATKFSYRNPDGPEAADEITRLNAENAELRAALLDTQERSRARGALVDEMREGLEPFAKAYDEIADGKAVWIERPINDDGSLMIQHFRQARALITKASRDSGHG